MPKDVVDLSLALLTVRRPVREEQGGELTGLR